MAETPKRPSTAVFEALASMPSCASAKRWTRSERRGSWRKAALRRALAIAARMQVFKKPAFQPSPIRASTKPSLTAPARPRLLHAATGAAGRLGDLIAGFRRGLTLWPFGLNVGFRLQAVSVPVIKQRYLVRDGLIDERGQCRSLNTGDPLFRRLSVWHGLSIGHGRQGEAAGAERTRLIAIAVEKTNMAIAIANCAL